ncbi:50S ribosomal protein L29 [Acidipila sp. EB88]|uniref:50S ribosomal protein L29 n=1 Tax=Acidipila sp. EB88 TaxID=2305226 RepID=UPI000F5E5C3E|nr:50S ribosomal protein L29 [Acidipila sp. EB88]RRA47821.1 50S ribosomal protein L29 [Acidipila sp. EB88]
METTKVRALGDAELRDETRKIAEQLFRIRFQLKLGQNEGVKKLRELKKDVARFKTIERERALGIRGTATAVAPATKGRKAAKEAS